MKHFSFLSCVSIVLILATNAAYCMEQSSGSTQQNIPQSSDRQQRVECYFPAANSESEFTVIPCEVLERIKAFFDKTNSKKENTDTHEQR